jgi:hypothetical protein
MQDICHDSEFREMEIDTRIRELAPVAQPVEIVAEIQPIH